MISAATPTRIGELEQLAGVEDRPLFWRSFASNGEGFRLGVAELKRRIAAVPSFTCSEVVACRTCGCTDDRACMTEHGPCSWVEADLCSACAPPARTAFEALLNLHAAIMNGIRVTVSQFEALIEAERGPLRYSTCGWTATGARGYKTSTVTKLIKLGFLTREQVGQAGRGQYVLNDAGRDCLKTLRARMAGGRT